MTAGRGAVAAATLAYVAALHIVYQHSIAPAFSYLRYAYRDPDPWSYALAVALVVALAMVLPRRIARPSVFVAWVLLVVAVAPAILVPQYAPVLSTAESTELALWVAGSYLPVALLGTRRAVRGTLPRFRLPPSTFWTALAVVAAGAYVFVLAVVGFRWELPSLDDVYGVRGEFKEDQDRSDLLGYVVPLLANVLNPAVVARGLYTRRWTWVVVGVVGQVFVFSFTGYRSAVLSPLALGLAFLLFRRGSRPAAAAVQAGAAVMAFAMMLLDWLTSSIDYTSLLVRRFLVTPGLLTAGYVSVFGDIDKVWLSHSFLSAFSDYPYAAEPPLLVGNLFFGDPDTNANANLLADGFANFGYPGMVLECLVLMVLLWCVDAAAEGLPVGAASLVLLMPTLALADSGIFTTMLTHGLVAAILLCLVAPRTGWEAGRPASVGSRGARTP